MSFYGNLITEAAHTDVVTEGFKEWWAKVKDSAAKNKEYNKKYQEWLAKAREEGKTFFPALSTEEVDQFFKVDSENYFKDGKHAKQLVAMYENVEENLKNKNYIDEQIPIMKYWLKVYKPLYEEAKKKMENK